MMLGGVSGMMGSSGEGGSAAEHPHESGGASGGSSEVGGSSSVALEEIEKSGGGGGNRWPRQETLALIQIRHNMDSTFRDSSLKGPLWEEVSRKMAELGFHRSAKKCKEKFENVFKYHKRTKDGRASKPDGKTYRFFEQLEALENTTQPQFTPPPPRSVAAPPPPPNLVPMPPNVVITTTATASVPSTSPSPTPISIIPPQNSNPQLNPIHHQSHISNMFMSNSTSSSTSSDEDIQRRRGKKRKWKDYFERLMRDVVQKQEEMQRRFLDALERRERDRMVREEAWRAQEMERLSREHEVLVKERKKTALKDEAILAFLQKVNDQPNLQIPVSITATHQAAAVTTSSQPPPPQVTMQVQSTPPPQRPQVQSTPPPQRPQPHQSARTPQPPLLTKTVARTSETSKSDNEGVGDGGETYNNALTSPSRWPKAEVQALINLRTSLDLKYQENGPKGPLWEEISSAMSKLGYSRSAKRCKEKWENINKYYKKVKESSKKRPDDSKTCPYFHQLEAIYKARNEVVSPNSFNPVGYALKPDNPGNPIMARPEQQWPVLPQQQQQQEEGAGTTNALMHDHHRQHEEAARHNDNDIAENNEDIEFEDEDDDDDDDDQGGGFVMIANTTTKQTASNTAE